MAYAVIELLTLNFALHPPLRQTDVQATPSVSVLPNHVIPFKNKLSIFKIHKIF